MTKGITISAILSLLLSLLIAQRKIDASAIRSKMQWLTPNWESLWKVNQPFSGYLGENIHITHDFGVPDENN